LALGRGIRVVTIEKQVLQVALGILPILTVRGVPGDIIFLD
jgi:hypothetical protein